GFCSTELVPLSSVGKLPVTCSALDAASVIIINAKKYDFQECADPLFPPAVFQAHNASFGVENIG
ncbi:MAG: hypothetical protein ACPH56_14850, partial [Spongiibacter marinus]|uniref:hypothetical protein n=1 Tax=Spongiibacter marinus TaxID=354246 RepID=UPI003C657382